MWNLLEPVERRIHRAVDDQVLDAGDQCCKVVELCGHSEAEEPAVCPEVLVDVVSRLGREGNGLRGDEDNPAFQSFAVWTPTHRGR